MTSNFVLQTSDFRLQTIIDAPASTLHTLFVVNRPCRGVTSVINRLFWFKLPITVVHLTRYCARCAFGTIYKHAIIVFYEHRPFRGSDWQERSKHPKSDQKVVET